MDRRLISILCAGLPLPLAGCGKDEPAAGPSVVTPAPSGPASTAWFVDRRPGSGVDFVHHTGGSGRKYLVEITGSGLSLFDLDGDGDLDLYCCQGAALPGLDPAAMDGRDRLYRNDGAFRFHDVTDATRAWDETYTFSAACPDLDADGDPEIYLSNFGENHLLRNDGGVFSDATQDCGLGIGGWSVVSAFADLDRDGDLDVYVCNYVEDALSKEGCDNGQGEAFRTFCNPDEFPGGQDHLLANDGHGRFADVTVAAGLGAAISSGLGIVPSDFDDDGDLDLFVSNDGRPNFLWRNDGELHFTDVGMEAGVSVGGNGLSEACMGVDSGDIDGDGDFDLFLTNLAGETNALYRNEGGLFFDDLRVATGLGPPSLPFVGFGCRLFDADLDGNLDAIVANGHVIDNPRQLDASTTVLQPPQLFRGSARGRFELVPAAQAGPYFEGAYLGRGLAVGDLDGDGDLDVAIAQNGGAPALLENRAPQGHFLALRLVGRDGNRAALGAKVAIEAGAHEAVDEVRGTASFCAWQELVLRFGLPGSGAVDRVIVRWPRGRTTTYSNLAADTLHLLEEPAD